MRLPRDFTQTELELYNYLITGNIKNMATASLYEKLEDPVDKFLVAYVFELGNTRVLAEQALGLSKATIWSKIKRIKRILAEYYKI
ncbi:MAG: hypothetical protein K0U38_01470 [Epsilonproteobacteria bacterium]|nr:hypothetical protein [Campylobacterota bacterium]